MDVSSDLRLAKIYLSILEKDADHKKYVFKTLINQKNNIRYKIGAELNSKYVPDIKFYLDDEYEYYDNINKIMKNG